MHARKQSFRLKNADLGDDELQEYARAKKN